MPGGDVAAGQFTKRHEAAEATCGQGPLRQLWCRAHTGRISQSSAVGDVPQPSGGRSTTCPRSGLAHITAADGRSGVARSGVKPTAYCSVMICTDPPRYGSAGLPPAEYPNAFRVLVSVFAVADTCCRETYCKGACGHAWHHLPTATEQP
ncbi:DUF5958 family protein [Streptomyces olivaceoviridis]|uniref:DUF5958 family protein n=1 Tax=Streptomyces olivaceoviridis TaxID=1921 RepID=UPI00379A41B8